MPILAIPFPAIDPVLVQVGPFAIRWYALAYIAGIVGGWLLARRLAASPMLWGARPRPGAMVVDDLLVAITLGIVLGGRIGYVLFYNLPLFLADPSEIIAVWRGGMSFHGGLLGVVIALVLVARSHRASFLALLDLAASVTPIGIGLGRLANFINGELWGRTTDVPWAMVFPTGGPEPRHPSQLYEAGLEGLALFILMMVAVRLGAFARPGRVSALFAIGYGLARITCEFFREPDVQLGYLFGGATMGMLLSAPLVIGGLALLAWTMRPPTGVVATTAAVPAADRPA